jgi:hypothetical protein
MPQSVIFHAILVRHSRLSTSVRAGTVYKSTADHLPESDGCYSPFAAPPTSYQRRELVMVSKVLMLMVYGGCAEDRDGQPIEKVRGSSTN